jgi:diguanylate cyclase (GGDEF)-like protein
MNKNCLLNALYAGHVDESSSDVRKQILISSLFSLVSIILLFIFGLDALRIGKSLLATIVLSFAVINGVNYFFLYRTGNYQRSSMVILVLMIILCFYLLCSGGNKNTGALWFFILPSLIFYILGLRRGMITLSTVLGMAVCILYIPENPLLQTTYFPDFIYRFTGALFSVSVIAFAYEYTREDGRKELLNLSRKLDQLSRKDELTGLSNRRDIVESLRNEVNRFERSGHSFSVLIADIDHFKIVNDTHGHDYGDYVLRQVASTLSKNTQKRDTVARWGGEEFLILLPETNIHQAVKSARRLQQAIENLSIAYNNRSVAITISIGVAEYQPGVTLNELINAADKLLYQAKHEGRNRVRSSAA